MGRFFNDREALQKATVDEVARFLNDPNPDLKKQNPAITTVGFLRGLIAFVSGYANVIAVRTLELHDELETRIKALEERQLEYLGVWQQGKAYAKGHLVSDGGLWHCNVTGTAQTSEGDDLGLDARGAART